MKVKYVSVVVCWVVLLFWAVMGTMTVYAQDVVQPDLSLAVEWLLDNHQNEDGGFSSFSAGANQAPSDVGGTLDVLLALASADVATAVPLDYLREHSPELTDYAAIDGSTAGKIAIALTVAGENPREFAGNDFVVQLTDHLSSTGQLSVNTPYAQSLGILGLALANEGVPETAVAWLIDQQAEDGSWDDGFGTVGNPDATAMALMALVAAGEEGAAIESAVNFLIGAQLESGGWEYGAGFGENVNSTALAVQALRPMGADLAVEKGLATLADWQSESGALQADFGDGRFDDFFSTVQAIPALSGLIYAQGGIRTGSETVAMPMVVVDAPTLDNADTVEESATNEDCVTTSDAADASCEQEAVNDLAMANEEMPTASNWLPFLLIGLAVIVAAGLLVLARQSKA